MFVNIIEYAIAVKNTTVPALLVYMKLFIWWVRGNGTVLTLNSNSGSLNAVFKIDSYIN